MRILITGHQGYIGTVLTPMLVKQGHEVVGLDINLYEGCDFGNGAVDIPSIRKDIRDVEASDVSGFDAICHLAALSNDPLGDINADLTYDINYRASVRLAELARENGVKRFIFSSSCSNYGAADGESLLDENSPFNPVTPYGKSKVMVEKELSNMADDNFSPTYLRNATAYGASPRLRLDLVINDLTAWGVTTGKIVMKSDGSPWRPIVHVEDISRAFLAVLEAPRELVFNQAFNVGVTSDNLQIRDMARMVSETVSGCEVSLANNAAPDKRNYRVNCDKLPRVIPSFQPEWNARLGIEQLYQAYTENGLTLAEHEGPRYRRIGQVKKLIQAGIIDESLRYKQPCRS